MQKLSLIGIAIFVISIISGLAIATLGLYNILDYLYVNHYDIYIDIVMIFLGVCIYLIGDRGIKYYLLSKNDK
jgi:uncharacterized membrane protein (DUF441 family)